MLDPQLFRNDIDAVAKRLADRPFVLDVAAFQAIEAERRTVQIRTQELQAGRNAFAKRIGQAKGKGEDTTHNQKKRNKQRRVHGNSLPQYRKYANFIARRNRIEESQ